jgi:2-oxoglutarate ferredoxin oxidoreductase subunit alpha
MAFNLAEQYRVPAVVLLDECVGHMFEKVVIPPPEQIQVYPRRYTQQPVGSYRPYQVEYDGWIPGMAKAGDGHFFHITGLTHDERGYPVMNAETQELCVRRLVDKILKNQHQIECNEERHLDDAEVVVIAFGITSRVAYSAVEAARARGIKAGLFRPKVLWPFPEKRVHALACQARALVVAELNYGQVYYEVQRCAAGQSSITLIDHGGGTVHEPERLLEGIAQAGGS